MGAETTLLPKNYHYTAQETVTFFDVPGNFVFRSIVDYIYHQITCDTTGKVAQEV